MEVSKLLRTKEAAATLGVAEKTLQNWRILGVGPRFIKSGRNVAYAPEDLILWREARRIGSTSEQLRSGSEHGCVHDA